ncbi:MAG: phosphatidate cytidylyltransferase [Saprospirales bacterium]|nr:phosphatidate cytidylyltransferase [Saprospirales bacterium]
MNGFARRSLTAALFGAVVIGCILAGPIPFGLLFLAVAFLCLWEFFHLVSSEFSWPEAAGIALGLLPFLWQGLVIFSPCPGSRICWFGYCFSPCSAPRC